MTRINACRDDLDVEAANILMVPAVSHTTTFPLGCSDPSTSLDSDDIHNTNTNNKKNNTSLVKKRGNYRREKPNYKNRTNTYNLGQLWLTDEFGFASFDEGFSGRLMSGCGSLSKNIENYGKNAKSDLVVLTVAYYYPNILPELSLNKYGKSEARSLFRSIRSEKRTFQAIYGILKLITRIVKSHCKLKLLNFFYF